MENTAKVVGGAVNGNAKDSFELICMADVVPATAEELRIDEIRYRKAVHAGLNLAHDWMREGHSMASLARLVHLSLTSRYDSKMGGRFIEYLRKKGNSWKYKSMKRNRTWVHM